MNTINMPRFTAEASVYNFARQYAVDSATVQRKDSQSSGTIELSLIDWTTLFPTIRCCRRDPFTHRFVCSSRTHNPSEQCFCLDGIPICRPPVFQSAT